MGKILYCRRCGTKLLDQPGGSCPRCLLGAAMQPEPPQPGPAPLQATAEGAGLGDAPPTVDSPPRIVPDASELPTASELAPYFPQLEILELLGRGGMGAVYKARQRGLDRLVAVKILPPSAGQAPGFAERFTREARALARLSHRGIVSVYDFGHAQGLYYFIMEFVDGPDLRRLIRSGKMTPKEALAIVPQICDALQYAHDAGVIHRDIKPENILLDSRGQVKIADFGLAKLFGQATPDYTLTAAECSMGTPRYMAPEQMDNPRSVDHRADIYSLGVVFYEMLTGEVPAGRFAVPSQKSTADVRLDPVVLRSLEREPALRYQKVSDVKTAVESACSSPPIPPRLPRALPQMAAARRQRSRKPVAIFAALGVFIIFFMSLIVIPLLARRTAVRSAERTAPTMDTQATKQQASGQQNVESVAALMRAVEQGDTQEVRVLLSTGANANARDTSGDTPLTRAATLGLLAPAQVLLSFSADPEARSAAGSTPLALAAANGHADLVDLLNNYRAQIDARGNSRGQTALSLAASNGHVKAVEYLLARGADPNLRDRYDLTPLVYALAHGWSEVVPLLRRGGATEDHNYLFTEAYLNVLDKRPADAIIQLEKLLKLGAPEFQVVNWYIVSKDRIYIVPDPRLVLSLVLAECYKRSDQAIKAQEVLAKLGLYTSRILLYWIVQPETSSGEQEYYYLSPNSLGAWSRDVSSEPEVEVETQTGDARTHKGSTSGIVH